MKYLILPIFLFSSFWLQAQTDYWQYLVYFSGCPINHIPKGITIPDRDPASRAILNAIIGGDSYNNLTEKFHDSLDTRLEKLIAGKVIERKGENFKLLIPVLTGKKRDELRTLIQQQVKRSGLTADTLVHALKQALPQHPEMVFHFLWSRIIDETWWNSYNATFHTDEGPPSIVFIVASPHPFQCGTNSDYSPRNDMFAMSWSCNLFDETFAVPSSKSFFSLADRKDVPGNDLVFFRQHGLLDTNNQSQIFSYAVNDPLDLLCDSLKTVYIGMIRGLFDFRQLSTTFGIPANDLYLVVLHETAYELIGALDAKKSLLIPITREANPQLNFKFLVSIRYNTK